MKIFNNKLLKIIAVLTGFSNQTLFLISKIRHYEIKKCLSNTIKENTVLITEPNDCHGEVIPGIVKYYKDLNYNVEVILTNKLASKKPLEMFKDIKVFSFESWQYEKILNHKALNNYKKIIFTSSRLYRSLGNSNTIFLFDYFKNTQIEKNKILFIEHHLDLLKKEEKENYVFAGLANFSKNFEIKMINPHYFEKTKDHIKNKKTRFIVIGAIQKSRKNHELLFDSCKSLIQNGKKNFEIIIIGRGKLEFQDAIFKNHVKHLGCLNYDKMYLEIAKSDYILGLYDPENDDHERYIKTGTSGTFQLSYGFLKPLILHRKFANAHFLNESNSIIYDDSKLADALSFAINEENIKYQNKIKNLKNTQEMIYNQSILNLKEIENCN